MTKEEVVRGREVRVVRGRQDCIGLKAVILSDEPFERYGGVCVEIDFDDGDGGWSWFISQLELIERKNATPLSLPG